MSHGILVIEDDIDARANLQDILELDGYCVTLAGSLKEATEHRTWSEYAVILIDRKLPDGTADVILPQIQQAAPHTAVIVITGYADLDGTIAALRSGAADYLLKPINPDLLRAAITRVLKLQEMEERIRQAERLAAIGQMLTVLTHESGNALGRSQALLDTLADEVHGQPEALELIKGLQKAQVDLRRLYEEVRNYAAPIELDHEHWNLATIWRQAWANSLLAARNRPEATLVDDDQATSLDCEVDSFRLDQVFRNLFENSLAACAGPVRVKLTCSDSTIHSHPAIRISVRDNGPGLTVDQAKRVFEAFYTTKSRGTGLGMAIVKRIVEAHGGSIVVGESAITGAEFIITLPRRQLPQE